MKSRKRKKKINIKIIFKCIEEKIKFTYDCFMQLPKYVRSIIYVWMLVIFVIIGLVIVSSRNTNFLSDYKDFEKIMSDSALDYVKTNEFYPTEDSKLKVDMHVLIDYGHMYEEDIVDKSCSGFSIVYYDDKEEDYRVESYLNCKKYTTDGYNDYK